MPSGVFLKTDRLLLCGRCSQDEHLLLKNKSCDGLVFSYAVFQKTSSVDPKKINTDLCFFEKMNTVL